jgi:serine/threonine protein kinase
MRIPEALGEGGRYQVDGEIGRGGMGAVYRALDKNTGQYVAIKVMLDVSNPDILVLFDKEWRILAELQHTNIIGINDRGEFRDGPARYPYFVMPFLRGKTLHEWIAAKGNSPSVTEVANIINAAAAGLQAAHSRGVIHRDIKPSNIFVLDSGSVVVIDFGVVHLGDSQTRTTIKGTTPYMAPELLDPQKHERPSAQSDLYALGVVCYEALTGVQPFSRPNARDTVRAILRDIPTPAYELNRGVSLLVGQVVQKAMAKDRNHRFKTVTEFAEKLQRAVRSETLPEFDRRAIEERLRIVRDALAKGQPTSANEILRGIEEEGYVDPSITSQREKIDQALQQNWVRVQLESVRLHREAKEFVTALERVNEVLNAVPDHPDALAERDLIDQERLSNALNEARRHMDKHAFAAARTAIEEARQVHPRDTQTSELLSELARMEETDRLLAEQKEALYQEAQSANRDGNINSALQKLERLMRLTRDAGPSSNVERDSIYQRLYEEVMHEHSRIHKAFQDARNYLDAGKLSQTYTICDQMLATNPGHPLFLALKLEAENREREMRLEYVQSVCARLSEVPDLERRVALMQEAATRYPGESQLMELLRNVKGSRDLVNSVIARARKAEECGEFREALDRWQVVKQFHPSQPGLKVEILRIEKRLEEQQRTARKAVFTEDIWRFLSAGDYDRVAAACSTALTEFPGDPELLALQSDAQDQRSRSAEVKGLLAEGRELLRDNKVEAALETLRRAHALARNNQEARQFLGVAILDKAQILLETDWLAADQLLQEAKALIPNDPAVKALAGLIADRKQRDTIEVCLAKVRRLALAGDRATALSELEDCLRSYPNDRRLQSERARIAAVAPDVAPSPAPGPATPAAAVPPAKTPGVEPAAAEEVGETVFDPLETIPPAAPAPAAVPNRPPPAKPIPAFQDRLTELWTPVRDGAKEQWARLAKAIVEIDWSWWKALSPNQRLIAATGAAILVVALAALSYRVLSHRQPPPQPVAKLVRVQIVSTPGAQLSVDGKAVGESTVFRDLEPGNHTIAASLRGYQSKSASINADGKTTSLNVELAPLPLRLRVVTDQAKATVQVDDNPASDLQNGEIVIPDLKAGLHTILVKGQTEVTAAFRYTPGEALSPELPASPSPLVLFAGSSEGKTFAQCNCSSAKLTAGGADYTVSAAGLDLPLSSGDNVATVDVPGGKKQVTLSVAGAPDATIAMFWGTKVREADPVKTFDPEIQLDRAEQEISKLAYRNAEILVDGVLARFPGNKRAQGMKRRLNNIKKLSPF